MNSCDAAALSHLFYYGPSARRALARDLQGRHRSLHDGRNSFISEGSRQRQPDRWMCPRRRVDVKPLAMRPPPATVSRRAFISPGMKRPSVGKPVDVSPIYWPLCVPCNSPAPGAQLDRQTPQGAVGFGKARPISFPSGVRTPLNCHVGLLHRP